MKKDKKEYCLIGLSDFNPLEVLNLANNVEESGIKVNHGVSTIPPDRTIKVKHIVDKDYLIKNAIDYLKSLGCTPEKYKELYERNNNETNNNR